MGSLVTPDYGAQLAGYISDAHGVWVSSGHYYSIKYITFRKDSKEFS
jgi:hypothetical protein